MKDFEGLVVVVTGGASGIGAATVECVTDRGATVVCLDRNVPTVGVSSLSIACDVTSTSQVNEAISRIVEQFGGIDVLVNNAGIGAEGDVAANSDDEWHRVLDINVLGYVRAARACLPHLRRSPHAAVVNVSSTIAIVGVPARALYTASKAAVAGLTVAMAADHVREGIRVNAVAPGTVDTPWVDRLLSDVDDPVQAAAALRRRQPIGRLVHPTEVAAAIAYLSSPQSASTTGVILQVDGGMSTLRLPTQPV